MLLFLCFFLQPDNEKGYSLEGSNSDSDTFESDTGAPQSAQDNQHHASSMAFRESSKLSSSKHSMGGTGGLPINVKYNSIYHNAGTNKCFFCSCYVLVLFS